jgi:hypothetical protein
MSDNTKSKPVLNVNVFSGPNFEATYDDEGYLGEVETAALFLKIRASRSHLVVRIIADKKGIRQEGDAMFGTSFDQTIKVNEVMFDAMATKPGENDIRLIVLSRNGELTYIQYAIVSQWKKAWLIGQVKVSGQLYRSPEGQLRMNEKIRPELLEILRKIKKLEKINLPSTDEMPESAVEAGFPALGEGEGIVDWYDECRQTGAIIVSCDGRPVPVKVHFSQCPVHTKNGWRGLSKGDRITTKALVPFEGCSSFQFEAKGVEVSTPMANVG